MNKLSFALPFAIGLVIVAWVGMGFAAGSWLPLAVTAVILAVYVLGAVELSRFRASTAGLHKALQDLSQPPASLGDWLERVPAGLRAAVRQRVEADRGTLPGPALTPYLVGLLVMLGMLGTFLGMVVTFKGAVFALEGSTDLQAIRGALAEPVRGLGLSFGTSVAGVAASAMLGLLSALSRRERAEAVRLLDSRMADALQPFSLVHQRQESFRAQQLQARALPELVDALQALMQRIEARSEQLDQQLLERHAQFQRDATHAYTELARGVGASLQENLVAGARQAGETIRPVVEGAMAQVVQESQRTHERLAAAAQAQVDALSQQFGATARTVSDSWTAALQTHARTSEALATQLQGCLSGFSETFEQRSAALLAGVGEHADAHAAATLAESTRLLEQSRALVQSREEAESRWVTQQGERMEQLTALWRTELAALREQENRNGQAAVERLGELQAAVAQHLGTLGAALEAPITRLLHTASEVPEAAAGVIAQLREEMSRVAERDNLALQERSELLARLSALLQSVNQAAGEQRAATEALLAAAASVLEQAGARFAQVLEAQSGQAATTAAHTTASAVELSSLAEAFGHSVQLFQGGNEKLVETLQRVEASLERSTARSDEQLAYYVAQAREVIDLSISSQHDLLENLRTLQVAPARPAAVAVGVPG
ncbi:hypothetical protein GCM10027034_28350 [Ramlibacter solisilvae]|uniref:Membrane protein n=1 Tax=Ramlibacter tataouinensis TaxID=94132 RepID=A0A127JR44_9BURK|nr:DUF802 domain-containing protein [Ramlibacter tataouinensis]AMO22466.1 membrane protein [Ramlibacter tataouinensis]